MRAAPPGVITYARPYTPPGRVVPDGFPSREYAGRTLRVDEVGKEACPIIDALARGRHSEADALYTRLPTTPKFRPAVLAMVGHYFAYEPPAAEPKTTRKRRK